MLNHKNCAPVLVFFLLASNTLFSQVNTQTAILQRAAIDHAAKEKSLYQQLEQLSKEKGWPMTIKGKNGKYAILSGIDPMGYPVYTTTLNNIISAATIRTDKLWPGGSTGLNLNGSSANLKDKLALWDGGKVRPTHVELAGRILQKDVDTVLFDHSTHVAGTLIASGVNPVAKGMAFGLQRLITYDFNNYLSEMLSESPNLLSSNHSYGAIAGWYFNDQANRWEFWGQANANEDYKFGYYDADSQMLDSIAYNAPNYLIVKSVGNNRDENGPAVGSPYYRYNTSNQMANAGNRPIGISNNDTFDIIPTYGVAKNILTVGAVNPIPGGYNTPQDVVMTTFSSWGPTDDGRIKPDVVTDGVNVLSSVATGDNDYAFMTGTSMSTPAAAGSVMLLQEYYTRLHGATSYLRSATVKGMIIHTADDAGTAPGPDYKFGWGLINMERAASMITSNNTDQLIQENVLNNGQTFTLNVVASGKGPLVVTISWTDPKGSVDLTNILNNPAKKLVSDLDVRVTKGATTYFPWILDPINRNNAATKGDNTLDNVEKIEIPDAIPGQTYTIKVTHKGTLVRGSQAYSLLVSGVGGTAYCASASTTTGARIDSLSFGSLRRQNPATCPTTYVDSTSATADIEPNSTIPLYIKLNSCSGANVDKIVTVYIDYNNNGNFTDAGEMIAQSGVINGNTAFSTNVTIPSTVTVGNYSIMRVVVEEVSSPAGLTSCGSYTKGETQDFRIHIANPSNDLGVVEVISPENSTCASGSQYLSVHVKNFGSSSKTGFPLTATVKAGATTVATLNGVYKGNLAGYSDDVFTFQTPFVLTAGTTYTITSQVNLAGDQNSTNDQVVASSITNSADASQAGTAEKCGNQVYLSTTATTYDGFFWYNSATATTPIASGNNATINTSQLPGDSTLYLGKNDYYGSVGPVSKNVFVDGGYNAFNGNFVNFTAGMPLIIQTARLYFGRPGQVTFIVADISNYNAATGSYNYLPYSSVTINAWQTSDTAITFPGGQVNNSHDTGAVFLLNLVVPTAGNHSIIILDPGNALIYRNNNLTGTTYPTGMPGVFTWTGNSANSSTDPSFFQKFYYFFYDTRIAFADCPSTRAAVTARPAPTPVITVNGNTFTSSIAAGNQWYKNSAVIPGAVNQTYNAQVSGAYYTVVTDALGCQQQSNTVNLTVTGIPTIDPAEIGLKVLPNPNNGIFTLDFNVRDRADLSISLVNMIGQEVFRDNYPNFTGQFTKQMQVGKLSSGVYLLRLQHGNKLYIKKLIIEN